MIYCGVLASLELLKNGGRFTTPSKVPVPSVHKSSTNPLSHPNFDDLRMVQGNRAAAVLCVQKSLRDYSARPPSRSRR
jgi:hypothetical protein